MFANAGVPLIGASPAHRVHIHILHMLIITHTKLRRPTSIFEKRCIIDNDADWIRNIIIGAGDILRW